MVRALYTDGFVVIEAAGVLPRSGDRPEIRDTTEPTGGPRYAVLRCFGFGYDPEVEVPFLHKEVFAAATRPAQVAVQHAEGLEEVDVEDAGEDLRAFVDSLPVLGSLTHDSEATGYSRAMSFDEAFNDALSRLPAAPGTGGGRTRRISVVDTGALLGDGFCHLFVRVRREKD